MLADITIALGLVLILEGLVYVLAPSFLEQLLAMLRTLTEEQRRLIGLIAITIGAALILAAKTFGGG
ncbi:MAG: DUF2065 domain-containing protein [Pseudomonadota bacterium]